MHLNQRHRQLYFFLMTTFSVKPVRVPLILPFALAVAVGGLIGCLAADIAGPSSATSGTPDPTLLPAAARQVPDLVAYAALGVATRPAGFSYNGPVSGVKVWKVTSGSTPAPNSGAGHDYADGANQVSRGWGANNNNHTLLIRGAGMAYYLVDFTRGAGFSNYRVLPPAAQPKQDLRFSFSSLVSQPRIAYVINDGQLKRFNTATMQVENTGNFPLTTTLFGWLQQDKNDEWFVGLADASTVFAWNSRTNQLLTHAESWVNEPRLERDGRYVVLTNGGTTVRLWDLSTNTFGPTQTDPNFSFFHNADLRGQWVGTNNNATAPFAQDRYVPSGGQLAKVQFLAQSAGPDIHHAGNWVQSDAELGGNLNRQWSFVSGFSSAWPTVLSNMNGSGRYDLFVAEMPLR